MHHFASLFEFFRPAPTTCRAIKQDAMKRNIFELFTGVALDAAQPSRQRSRTPPVVGRRELLHKSCTKMHENAPLFRFFAIRDAMTGSHLLAFVSLP